MKTDKLKEKLLGERLKKIKKKKILLEKLERLTSNEINLLKESKENVNIELSLSINPEEIEEADEEGCFEPTDMGDKIQEKAEVFKKYVIAFSEKLRVVAKYTTESEEEYPWEYMFDVTGDKANVKKLVLAIEKLNERGFFHFRAWLQGEWIYSNSEITVLGDSID